MLLLFWTSLALLLYTYAGYPLWLLLLRWLVPQPVAKRHQEPRPLVSVIVIGRNEEKVIGRRLRNLFAQEYPSALLEILFVSDGSDDATVAEAIAAREAYARSMPICTIIDAQPAQGKPAGLNQAVAVARGEILVFTDCRQEFAAGAIGELVANFADPRVGAVSGELVFIEEGDGLQVEMGAYWRYEKAVRKLESATGSVIGVTGAVYALRRQLFRPHHPATILDDVVTPLQAMQAGYRVVFDEQAIAYDRISTDISKEWARKVRTLTGNWQILSLYPDLWKTPNWPLLFRFFSHKISRLLVPYGLLALLVSSSLLEGGLYRLALIGQLAAYALALLGLWNTSWQRYRGIRLLAFFCVLNAAALVSLGQWLLGRSGNVWKVAKGSSGKS